MKLERGLMTVIIATNTGEDIFIGFNDGSELNGTPIIGHSCPWILLDQWALGVTGESSVQMLLKYELKTRKNISDSAEMIWNINKILVENDVGLKEDGEFVRTFGASGILIHKTGKIWDFSGCLTLTEISRGEVWARGSGADYALGAYHALDKVGFAASMQEKLSIALEVAIENDIYCVGSGVVSALWGDSAPSQ
jgi:hypothetical protein